MNRWLNSKDEVVFASTCLSNSQSYYKVWRWTTQLITCANFWDILVRQMKLENKLGQKSEYTPEKEKLPKFKSDKKIQRGNCHDPCLMETASSWREDGSLEKISCPQMDQHFNVNWPDTLKSLYLWVWQKVTQVVASHSNTILLCWCFCDKHFYFISTKVSSQETSSQKVLNSLQW